MSIFIRNSLTTFTYLLTQVIPPLLPVGICTKYAYYLFVVVKKVYEAYLNDHHFEYSSN